jgi:hypothetical protein
MPLRFGFFQKLREAIAALYHALSRGRVRIRVTGGATGAFSASIFLWRPVQRATTLVEVRVILSVWQQARRMLWRSLPNYFYFCFWHGFAAQPYLLQEPFFFIL